MILLGTLITHLLWREGITVPMGNAFADYLTWLFRILPCFLAAIVGDLVPPLLGVHYNPYAILFVPPLSPLKLGAAVVAGIAFWRDRHGVCPTDAPPIACAQAGLPLR